MGNRAASASCDRRRRERSAFDTNAPCTVRCAQYSAQETACGTRDCDRYTIREPKRRLFGWPTSLLSCRVGWFRPDAMDQRLPQTFTYEYPHSSTSGPDVGMAVAGMAREPPGRDGRRRMGVLLCIFQDLFMARPS